MKIFSIVVLVTSVSGWGIDGHRTVAAIARSLLNEKAEHMVQTVLPEGETLVSIATWADEVGHTAPYAWSRCMHYVDTAGGECSLSNEDKECHCCVVAGIANYTSRLGDFSLGESHRLEALEFLVHLVGDATQPLHAGHKEDMGGNSIHVQLEWKHHTETNLHSVWDSALIELLLHQNEWQFENLASSLLDSVRNGVFPVDDWKRDCSVDSPKMCPEHMAEESAETACEFAYTDENGQAVVTGTSLSLKYFESRIEVVLRRLASGGVRLASILNSIGDNMSHQDFGLPELNVT
jgi:hypothetical protein